ncbi:hypothetical protein ACCO45_009397 [Purpureocillium lilacinum]|uniref:Uncharacterized protein n=1 Tax=Purpureocillium lilacinum TaxID=33203 RepID=A0ACC4DJJ5_PURLI
MSRTAHWVTDTQIPRLLVWVQWSSQAFSSLSLIVRPRGGAGDQLAAANGSLPDCSFLGPQRPGRAPPRRRIIAG